MDRIAMLNEYAKNREIEKQRVEKEKENYIDSLMKKITELTPRINEIVKIGKACCENKIPLVSNDTINQLYSNHHFCSNGWSHLLGFRDFQLKCDCIGIEGGGACDFDLFVVPNGNNPVKIFASGDIKYVLEKFLNSFELFESEFYKYIDRLCS